MRARIACQAAAIAVIVATSTSFAGADWPAFRGPAGLGVSKEAELPVRWNEGGENVVWKSELPGAGSSSPIVVGDRVYVTCYSGYGRGVADPGEIDDLRLWVVAAKTSDGEVIWKREIRPRLPEEDSVRDHGYAAPTPASDGRHIFVFFGKTGVFKLGLDGKVVWQQTVGDRTHGWGCGTSPFLFGPLVIVNASVESGSLIALHKETGKEVWRAGGMRESWNTPHLVDLPGGRKELVVSVKDRILAFDPRNGNELWRCRGIEDYVCPSVVSKDGIVYATGGRRSLVVAVRAGGRGDVTRTHRLWEARVGANVSSPVIHGDHLYGVSDRSGVAYCVRLADGEVAYSERVRGQPYASAVTANGTIWVVTRRDGTLVIAAKPEFELIGQNRLDDDSTFDASPAVSDGRLYIRSDRWLYAIGKKASS